MAFSERCVRFSSPLMFCHSYEVDDDDSSQSTLEASESMLYLDMDDEYSQPEGCTNNIAQACEELKPLLKRSSNHISPLVFENQQPRELSLMERSFFDMVNAVDDNLPNSHHEIQFDNTLDDRYFALHDQIDLMIADMTTQIVNDINRPKSASYKLDFRDPLSHFRVSDAESESSSESFITLSQEDRVTVCEDELNEFIGSLLETLCTELDEKMDYLNIGVSDRIGQSTYGKEMNSNLTLNDNEIAKDIATPDCLQTIGMCSSQRLPFVGGKRHLEIQDQGTELTSKVMKRSTTPSDGMLNLDRQLSLGMTATEHLIKRKNDEGDVNEFEPKCKFQKRPEIVEESMVSYLELETDVAGSLLPDCNDGKRWCIGNQMVMPFEYDLRHDFRTKFVSIANGIVPIPEASCHDCIEHVSNTNGLHVDNSISEVQKRDLQLDVGIENDTYSDLDINSNMQIEELQPCIGEPQVLEKGLQYDCKIKSKEQANNEQLDCIIESLVVENHDSPQLNGSIESKTACIQIVEGLPVAVDRASEAEYLRNIREMQKQISTHEIDVANNLCERSGIPSSTIFQPSDDEDADGKMEVQHGKLISPLTNTCRDQMVPGELDSREDLNDEPQLHSRGEDSGAYKDCKSSTVFRWQYPRFTEAPGEDDIQGNAEFQVVSLKTCKKPIRLGLSRKQKLQPLHKAIHKDN